MDTDPARLHSVRPDEAPNRLRAHDHSHDAPSIKLNMLVGGQRHEVKGQTRFRVDLRLQLPFPPAVIVFAGRQTKRFEWLGPLKKLVAPFASKKTRQHGVIGLPD